MFSRSFSRAAGLVKNARYFQSNPALRDGKPVATSTSAAPKTSTTPDPEKVIGAKMRRCTDFDKWLLVWMKKYPSKDQVPDKVTLDVIHKVQSQARIRTANLMIVATILGCIWAVISGKREAKAGRTVGQQNLDWHAEINKEFKASMANPKSS